MLTASLKKKIKNVLLTLSKPSGEIARLITNLRCSDMVAEGEWWWFHFSQKKYSIIAEQWAFAIDGLWRNHYMIIYCKHYSRKHSVLYAVNTDSSYCCCNSSENYQVSDICLKLSEKSYPWPPHKRDEDFWYERHMLK